MRRTPGAPSTDGRGVTPEDIQATRAARAEARRVRREEARVRLLVVGIWGTAAALSGLLALFALVS